MKADTNNHLVTKSNRFIEARYKLTLIQQKILLKYISLIQPNDEDFKEHEISVQEVAEMMGRKDTGCLYNELKAMAESFLSNPMLIPYEEGEGKGFNAYNWFSKFSYSPKEGKVVLRSDPDLKPLLLNISERFTRYRLEFVLKLRSTYSIRVYELCAQHKNLHGFTVGIDALKAQIGLESTEYKRFVDFRRRVLDVASQEINKQTDLFIEWEPIKTGRKFTKIKFTIKSKPKAVAEPEALQPLPTEDIFLLIPEQYQVDCAAIFKKIQKEAGDECLEWCIRYVLDAATKSEIKSFGAYLRSAYKNEYWKSFMEIEKTKAKLEEMQRAQAAEEAGRRATKEKKDNDKEREAKRRKDLVKRLEEVHPDQFHTLMEEANAAAGDKAFGRGVIINLFLWEEIDDFLERMNIEL